MFIRSPRLLLFFFLGISFIKNLSSQTPQWNSIGNGLDAVQCRTMIFDSINQTLIIGCDDADGSFNKVFYWNGGEVKRFGDGINSFLPYDFEYFKGKLYAVGLGILMGPFQHFAQFNPLDTTWEKVPNWHSGGLKINDAVVFNDELVLIGWYKMIGANPNSIIAYNGSTYREILNSYKSLGAEMWGGYAHDANLFVYGRFDTIGGQHIVNIVKYDGLNWTAVAKNDINTYRINTVCAFRDTLYAGTNEGDLYKLNNDTWELMDSTGGNIWRMNAFNDRLYIYGFIDKIGTVVCNNICYYDGKIFHDIDGGADDGVASMVFTREDIFALGYFTKIGGINSKGVARWGLPLGTPSLVPPDFGIKLFPNPNSGKFTVATVQPLSKVKVEVVDLCGKAILTKFFNEASNEFGISLPLNCPNGYYYLKVSSESISHSMPFIVIN